MFKRKDKRPAKLRLHKETLRQLTEAEARLAVGGIVCQGTNCPQNSGLPSNYINTQYYPCRTQ
jgi:hypothetical protein